MYLCLSSASREGYSKDVVDTLAAPVGGERQFRYDQKWVDPGLQDLVRRNALPANAKCLLCFVDLRGKPQAPFILPLREAILTRVIAVGTTYTLVFQLGAFRRPTDVRAFSDRARTALPELHRFRQIPGAQEPTGYLWADAKDQLDAQLKSAPTVNENWALAWEEIVRDYIAVMNAPDQYSKDFLDREELARDDQKFKDKSPFYVFYEFLHLPDRTQVRSTTTEGRPTFMLAPGSSYELSFYQYHPTKSFPDVSLKLATTQSNIQFTGNDERRFNTRYDVKRFTFSTADLLTGFSASTLVSRVFHDDTDAENTVEDFYLNFDVKGSIVKIGLYAIAIAAAFAVPQFLTLAKASPPSDTSTYIVVAIAALALGVLATMKDAFKFK
jgi:hypothetical protein